MSEAQRVLVIDDDEKIRSTVRRGLVYEGYRVVEASTGEEGLEKAREHLPDLVILDIMLPGMDGLEVCRRLRAGGGEVAVLMLTARDEVRDRVTGLETGADDYLVKPFSFEELLARGGLDDAVPLVGEAAAHHGPDLGVVVDDQDARGVGHSGEVPPAVTAPPDR